jgi:hypothetical protein
MVEAVDGREAAHVAAALRNFLFRCCHSGRVDSRSETQGQPFDLDSYLGVSGL